VLESDNEVDAMRDAVYNEMVSIMQTDPNLVTAAIDMIFVARNLERIGDHATNIAEDVVFMFQGVDVRHNVERIEQA
jgi:phosphate transport system protein